MSYRKANLQTTPVHLHNLSPQKYGKAAFDDNRCYTPSKLADNVLYRQVTTMKKVQEGNGKLRQFEALNSLLRERLAQAQQEKQGIQKTLNQQISMYKKMLKQKEENNQHRLRQIQTNFREEIRVLILQKQEESKYFQSEKELLEDKILQMQNYIAQLNERLSMEAAAFNDLKNVKQKGQLQFNNLQEKFAKSEEEKNQQISKLQTRCNKLHEDHKQSQAEWKVQLQGTIYKKDIERQNLKKSLQSSIQKWQSQLKSANEGALKQQKQQSILIQELKQTIESQAHHNQALLDKQSQKHFEALQLKEQVIEHMHQDISVLKEQVSTMNSDNEKLARQVHEYSDQNKLLAYELKEYDMLNSKEKDSLLVHIDSLKEEIKLNQVNYIRQKDKNMAIYDENRALHSQSHSTQILTQEVNKLRDLLVESSREIEVCREKFVSFERENRTLRHEMDRLVSENDSLIRLRRELEEESIKWRQNYLRVAH